MKAQFKEIEADGCAEGVKKRVERPSIIGEKDLPGLEMRNRTLDGSADGTDLVIVFVFTRVEFTILWLLGPWPVVLYFPAQSSGSRSHDQHGHNVPSTSASLPRVICLASSASVRHSSVARAISGVNSVMMSETVPWEIPKRSPMTSSIIFCRL